MFSGSSIFILLTFKNLDTAVNVELQGLCGRMFGRAAAERKAGERRAAGLPGDALGDVPQDVCRVGGAAEPLRRHAP
jgi:hypothetical protein